MASTIIKDIQQLIGIRPEGHDPVYGKDLAILPSIDNAYLMVEDGTIAQYGPMSELDDNRAIPTNSISASGQLVLPCWCDSHTHLVFAGSRENEFVDKIHGMSYAAINARGGGILNSAKKLNETSEDELFRLAWQRLEEIARLGTGAVEIKSGYGLSVEGELKMLRVIKKLKEKSSLLIRSTFLGAHTYPQAFREDHSSYIDSITNDMLPVIAAEKLADYIDVFCETGFFSAAEMETIVNAGKSYGLQPKLHVNQLHSIGGIEAGIALGARSLDHLETLNTEEIALLGNASANQSWKGVCTLLPAAAFFLRMAFQPARQLMDAGCAIALASDYNPGSAPSGNMNLVIALSCIQMKMLPEEAINAATVNGAYAMGLEKEAGSITVGKKANLVFTKKVPSLAYLPYSFGSNLIEKVMINGVFPS